MMKAQFFPFFSRPFAGFLFGLLFAPLFVAAANEGDWHTDYGQAMEKAKAENKLVLVEFHGSDWCPPCIELNKKVLGTEAFRELAEQSLVLVNADFPRKKEQPKQQRQHNKELGQRFGLQYFPTVVLLDTDETVLEKLVGFPEGGLKGFLAALKEHLPVEAGTGQNAKEG